MYDFRKIGWRTVFYGAAATAVAWGVLARLKLRGELPPAMSWLFILAVPAVGFFMYPALMFWTAWRIHSHNARRRGGRPVDLTGPPD